MTLGEHDGKQKREICYCHPKYYRNKLYEERNTVKAHGENYKGVEVEWCGSLNLAILHFWVYNFSELWDIKFWIVRLLFCGGNKLPFICPCYLYIKMSCGNQCQKITANKYGWKSQQCLFIPFRWSHTCQSLGKMSFNWFLFCQMTFGSKSNDDKYWPGILRNIQYPHKHILK